MGVSDIGEVREGSLRERREVNRVEGDGDDSRSFRFLVCTSWERGTKVLCFETERIGIGGGLGIWICRV